jgi:hypothetical protein
MSFVIDLLDSCLVVIDQGDDRIPVTGILDWFDNNEIAICDMFIAMESPRTRRAKRRVANRSGATVMVSRVSTASM